jgi:hypothetical protein
MRLRPGSMSTGEVHLHDVHRALAAVSYEVSERSNFLDWICVRANRCRQVDSVHWLKDPNRLAGFTLIEPFRVPIGRLLSAPRPISSEMPHRSALVHASERTWWDPGARGS